MSSAADEEIEPLDPLLVASALQEIQEQLGAHRTLLESLAEQVHATPPGGPWAWSYLDVDQRRELFTELRKWVDWLVVRYRLGTQDAYVPPCWFRHSIAVEELTALMVAWKAVYSKTARQPSSDLIAWHDRWLWPSVDRMKYRRVFHGCSATKHDETALGVGSTTNEGQFAGFLAAGATQVVGSGEQQADTTAGSTPPWVSIEHQTQPVPVLPHDDEVLSTEQVTRYVGAGAAVSLLDDIGSPVRIAGRWWACLDDEEFWTMVVDNAQILQLQSTWTRLQAIRDGEDA
ncbi:MAG: hypothetical protein ACRYF3_05400 [Janthinobacterium lividum]